MHRIHLLIALIILALPTGVYAQATKSPEQIRQEMAKIRQTTNWNDPEAARKANEEIRKLAGQLSGGKPSEAASTGRQQSSITRPAAVTSKKTDPTRENIVLIADRFFRRSYKTLDPVSRNRFDQDYKDADNQSFSLKSVRKLSSTGSIQMTMGKDHNLACVYVASAVKAFPADTLSVNNFGAYLRIIDSLDTAIPVLLYANSLYSKSPVILTQIGCSYFELNDLKLAENYLKEAVKFDPGFGQAHSALCELYIRQGKLREALLELFAGVKSMGASYNRVSSGFAYLQQQAEKNGTKEDFWEETRRQISPDDALAPLVTGIERIKMPRFGSCPTLADWTLGGGYAAAVQGYNGFQKVLKSFNDEFIRIHNEKPSLPPNMTLRDYPNERFALDCITEFFFQESKKEYEAYYKKIENLMSDVNRDMDQYLENRERYTGEFVKCAGGCGTDQYCVNECHRVYCTNECPAAKIVNQKLENYYKDYRDYFRETLEKQNEILNDLYSFADQWFARLESPYWSRIYSFEIQRVALTITGNAYMSYQQPFPQSAVNDCGTDCSAFANPYPTPPEVIEKKEPKVNHCPKDKKIGISLIICSISLDCESAEFGCSMGMSTSIKRNFVNKSTTTFIGVGAEGGIGFVKASASAGFTMTRYDNGDLDVGVKASASAAAGGAASYGKEYEVTATSMEGLRTDAKDVFGF